MSEEYANAVRKDEEIVLASVENTDRPPLTQFSSEPESGTRFKPPISGPKQKTKIRSETPPDGPYNDVEGPVSDREGHQATDINSISVSKRAYDVFSLMYLRKEKAFKSVDWDNFVHAMTEVGFTVKNNGGSAVLFERSSDLGGKIVFRKPHPIAKIDPIMLRSMGKRMAKWFSWILELFALDDTNKAQLHSFSLYPI